MAKRICCPFPYCRCGSDAGPDVRADSRRCTNFPGAGELECRGQPRIEGRESDGEENIGDAWRCSGRNLCGSDTCTMCHDDLYSKHFEGTRHFALLKEGEHGCEDCLGPGSAHVEGAGDTPKITRFSLRFSKNFTWHGGWNCYQYGEGSFVGPTLPRYFHANVTTLSVKYAF